MYIRGQRFDVGNKEGYLETSIQYGLKHPEIRKALKKYNINLANELKNKKFKIGNLNLISYSLF